MGKCPYCAKDVLEQHQCICPQCGCKRNDRAIWMHSEKSNKDFWVCSKGCAKAIMTELTYVKQITVGI